MRIFLAMALLAASVSTAAPIVMGNLSSADASVVMPAQQQPELLLIAMAGDRSLSGIHELLLRDPAGHVSQGDVAWTNGTAFDFNIAFNATTRALTYTVNTTTLVANLAASALISDLLIQTQVATQGLSMTVTTLGGTSSSSSSGQIDTLWISGLRDSFNINGRIQMSWYARAPTGSDAAATFRFGTANQAGALVFSNIPEPSTYWMCGAALLALGFWRARSVRQ